MVLGVHASTKIYTISHSTAHFYKNNFIKNIFFLKIMRSDVFNSVINKHNKKFNFLKIILINDFIKHSEIFTLYFRKRFLLNLKSF